MARIKVLDENTANKIAAGEVVERPAAVVKELVENSIDAGSKSIEVEIAEGGTSYIRVTDDGIGMSRQDAELSILRHATSKIKNAADLTAISTLGFRGEALPSIGAVSKFTLTTRQMGDDLAAQVALNGGIVEPIQEVGAGIGTSVVVEDLFFNTPARRKFLKSVTAESGHISDIIGKLALSNPNIAFKFINNKKIVLLTTGNGKLQDVIACMYGHKVAPDLIPVQYFQDEITIAGFVGKPALLKSGRQWQTFIVNKRVVNNRMLVKALDNGYFSLVPKNGNPLVVLDVMIPLNSIDVNVHPQKKEVKFSDEQQIYRIVYKAILEALANKLPDKDAKEGSIAAATVAPTHNNFFHDQGISSPNTAGKTYFHTLPKPQLLWQDNPDKLSFAEARDIIRQEKDYGHQDPMPETGAASLQLVPLGQIDSCYIIAQGDDGLYIIDQHAAHERIMYERLGRAAGRIPSQQLLVPVFLEFSSSDCDIIAEHKPLFYDLGFTLEQTGPDTMRLEETPADIPVDEAEPIIRQVLSLMQNMHQPTPETLRHSYLQIAACRAAIKAGDLLNMRQMQALLTELGSIQFPYTCPHGRPTTIRVSFAELAKMFKRT
ncbi:MAG TPA: DNA mismatch repair endonuclease MutL [Methylomusa anaerophila]|uniref:DNA mismatch repair endonuclease MutL n=1 Tax=Methylomusa anaerophila TaxID=1930071 RepID=UPI000F81DCD0|nr:DNA mismatch repair endonuclease MutL [Methylomusa anaerophila]HML87070.1 DNA mismatch repair endonuclease MutL [Methylomusa anaerophila]